MSLPLRRLGAALGVAAAVLGTAAVTAPTAHASTFKLVHVHYYQDSNALAECRSDGQAGVDASQWDYYRCIVLGPDYVELQGWLNIS